MPHPLKSIPFFADLNPSTREAVERVAVRRNYPLGSEILLEGDPCTAALFIEQGEARVYRISPEGREQVLARLSTGQSFNTVPALNPDGLNQASVRAMSALQVLVIPAEAFRTLLQSHADFSYRLLQDFGERLIHLTGLVEDLALRSVKGRLARFLLTNADHNGLQGNWTQDEMAENLGTVRDMIGRALKSLHEDGLIRRDRQRIVLVDREGLERLMNLD
jgi:CRP/FNR family transcriptional regulator